jgi:hypothetical protein
MSICSSDDLGTRAVALNEKGCRGGVVLRR